MTLRNYSLPSLIFTENDAEIVALIAKNDAIFVDRYMLDDAY